MTSRDYIWRSARRDLKLTDFPPLESSQVVVDVHDLNMPDRRQILYNHLKFGDQSKLFKMQAKPHLEEACGVSPFLPEVARRFGSRRFTEHLRPTRATIRAFFAHPLEHLRDVVGGLPPDGKAALALIYMAGGSLPSPVRFSAEQTAAMRLLESSSGGAVRALKEMQDGLVSLEPRTEDRTQRWVFRHPTIGEAFRSLIQGDPELSPVYLAGMSLRALLGEVTCGDVGVDGALIIPEADYPIMVERLTSGSDADMRSDVSTFLASRADCSFLRMYLSIDRRPISVGAQPISSALGIRLNECGLLPEMRRSELVAVRVEALFSELDPASVSEHSLALMREAERAALLDRVRNELLPSIDDYVSSLEFDYDEAEEPSTYLAAAEDCIERLQSLFGLIADSASVEVLDNALGRLADLEEELLEQFIGEPEPEYDRDWGQATGVVEDVGSEIFADVDS